MSAEAARPLAAEPLSNPEEGEGEATPGPSKSELKKRAKEAEKAQKAAEREAREAEEKRKREAVPSVDNASQNYGKLPLHQSQDRHGEQSPWVEGLQS